MGATEVVISRPSVVSPFRAQLTITGRRLGEVWHQILHNKTAMAGLCILIFFVFLALAAPWIAPYGPLQPVNDAPALSPPSPQVLSLKERMFVERAKMVGSSNTHLLLRHIFPNAFPLIFANTILTVAISILSESVLAFLNLSVRQNISWGRIVAEAQKNNAMTIGNPGWLIIPGLCIVFLVFGFYLFGYALDEILNPRLRRR